MDGEDWTQQLSYNQCSGMVAEIIPVMTVSLTAIQVSCADTSPCTQPNNPSYTLPCWAGARMLLNIDTRLIRNTRGNWMA